jgi:threonine aldolase
MSAKVWRGFASDNYAGVHPEILARVVEVNSGHQAAYGDDDVTAELTKVIKENFGKQAEVFPVFNGTGANVVALQAMCRSWEAVICAAGAHINVDEGGAPEKVAGLKLHIIETQDGKLTPELIEKQAWGFGNEHRAQPKVVSITQSTELGTIYTPEEVRAIVDQAHTMGMYVHLDGARISNGAAALGVPMRAFTTDVGVDVVSLGGTKNGAMAAEAVLILNPELADVIKFVRKSAMQLGSKMRFLSAQLLALFEGDLWLRNANQANSMAQRLYAGVANLPGVKVTKPEANALFPYLEQKVTEELQKNFRFYVWDHLTGQVRWMCSWDTTEQDIDDFVAAIKKAVGA